jgi:hypothetical protein
MSEAPIEPQPDPLLAALRQLTPLAAASPVEARLRQKAREGYISRFEGSTWHSPALSFASRFAMPMFLAGIVGIYMNWAMTAAATLLP